MQVYGRIENLLDEDYEEVFTYRTPGRAGYAGVRLKF
jgi:vitamin B12 transporter